MSRAAGDNTEAVTFSPAFSDGTVAVFMTLPTSDPSRFFVSAVGASNTGFTAHLYNNGAAAAGTTTAWYFAING